jgi:uncharacterized membrane protein
MTIEPDFSVKPLDRFASWVTTQVSTTRFFIIILAWTILWLCWNLLAPTKYQFDPPFGFSAWLFVSNVIQLLLMPLIMVGQAILGRDAESRAAQQIEMNIKTSKEIEMLLSLVDRNNKLLNSILSESDARNQNEK